MKHIKYATILFLAISFFSCNSDDELTQEQEAQNLKALFSEIENLVADEDCNDAAEWTFTAFGSKACGGPIGYIAYSSNIDTALFLEKIAEHRTAQQRFNERWGVISDCSVLASPTRVVCENGKAVLEY